MIKSALLACAIVAALSPPALIDAVRAADVATVRELVREGADVNASTGDGATALHWAAYRDDVQLVDVLLAAGARTRVANDLGVTPLHLASTNGNAAIVRALLIKGADPNAVSDGGITPLMHAARSGSEATVHALLAHGARVNHQEPGRSQTALMWAVASRHSAIVGLLLRHGADVHARTSTRTLTVMVDRGPRRIVKTSMQDARPMDAGGHTPILFAALTGVADSARRLIAAGANPNDIAGDGRSALVLATFAGHPAVARVLIEAGADVQAAGAGYSALHAAVLRGDLETARLLLTRGAAADATLTNGSPVRRFGSQWALSRTLTGATPLLVAAAYLEIDLMRALLTAGANPAQALQDGTTPLHAATGAPLELEARPSDLQRFHVVDSDSPAIPRPTNAVIAAVTLLLDAGVDVNAVNGTGDTALHLAAAGGLTDVIQLLAERGAALDLTNKAGLTPLALTLPRPRPDGRGVGSPGSPAAEALLRKLGAQR